jgi:uncharacterized protein involved in type VI secretion and phage assembly
MSLVELLQDCRASPKEARKIYGVVVGLVEDVVDPLSLGRIKVNFPWMGEAAEAVAISSGERRAHSYWARIATLMAGKERGSFFIPEVGDEVLVAFEHGDPDRPFVLGSLWNTEAAPPESMDGDGENNVRSIHSRSGHVITLDDTDGAEKIEITDAAGKQSIVFDSAENTITIRADGDVTIESKNGALKLAAKSGIEVASQAGAKVEASQNVDIEAGAQVNVKGSVINLN